MGGGWRAGKGWGTVGLLVLEVGGGGQRRLSMQLARELLVPRLPAATYHLELIACVIAASCVLCARPHVMPRFVWVCVHCLEFGLFGVYFAFFAQINAK